YWAEFDEDVRKNFMGLGIDTGDVPRDEWSFSKIYIPNVVNKCIHDSEACVEFFKALKSGKFDQKTATSLLQELSELKKMESNTELLHGHRERVIQDDETQKLVGQDERQKVLVEGKEQEEKTVAKETEEQKAVEENGEQKVVEETGEQKAVAENGEQKVVEEIEEQNAVEEYGE
ncbi:MAG: hypothetical protein Q9221_008685, partial [Calogaya cf. arnoldii]